MNDIAELGVKISTGEIKDADDLLKKLTETGRSTATAADLVKDSFGRLAAVLGPAALAGAIAAAVKGAINLQDEYTRLSEIAGTTAEKLSSFDLPARLSGTSLDTVATSVARLSKSLGDSLTAGGADKLGYFRALGIDPASGINAADAFVIVSKKLTEMKDQNLAASVSAVLLQRGFTELRPLMKEIAEQGTLVAATTNEDAAAAKRFNDGMVTLNFQLDQAKQRLANNLLPWLNDVAKAMNDAAQKGGLLGVAVAGIQTALTGSDLHKANVEIYDLTNKILLLENAAASARKDLESSRAPALDKARVEGFQREADALKERLRLVTQYKAMLEEEGKPKKPPAAGAGAADGSQTETERLLREQVEKTRLYDSNVAREKGYYDMVADTIKVGNELVDEQRKQGLISEEEAIRQTGANENARLQVLINSLEAQKKLFDEHGDVGKAAEAAAGIAQANAAIAANELVTQAKITSYREVTDLEWKRSIAARYEAIAQSQLTEQQALDAKLADEENTLEIWRGENADREEEYWIRLANLYGEYENRKTAITDEEERKRWGIQNVYHSLNAQSAGAFFSYMSVLMNTKSRELFEIGKAAAIGKAIIDTYTAANGAYSAMASIPIVGPALGAAAAAAAVLAGLANVQAIRSQSFGGGSGAVATFSASPTTGLPTGSPAPDAGQQSAAPQRNFSVEVKGNGLNRSVIEEIAQQLNELTKDGFPVIFTTKTV